MRNILILFLFALNAIASATNYYVSNSGRDTNDGLTEATAWRTISRVNLQKLEPGDSVLFKRGDVWNNERLRISSSGTEGNRITYSAYGQGDRPIFDGVIEVPGWGTEGNWTDEGDNVWSISVTGSNRARVWIDGAEKERSRYEAAGVGITEDYPWQKHNYVFYLYSLGNPATAYSSIKITSGNFIGSGSNSKDYITFNNLDIQGWETVSLKGCSNWIIEYCNIGKNSSSHGLEIERDGETLTTNGIIRHCTFDTHFPFYTIRVNSIDTDSWIYEITSAIEMPHGGQIDWDIHDNYFKSWGYTTFWLSNHNENGYMTEGIKFYDNYIEHEGHNYGRGIAGHQYVAQVNEDNPIEIYNNVVHEPMNSSRTGIAYAKIYNNIFDGARGDQYAPTYELFGYSGRKSYKTKIYNNIFANSNYFGMFWALRSTHEPVEDCEVVNNIFYNNANTQFQVNNTPDKVINPIVNNNIFYSSDRPDRVIRVYDTNMDVATFNALDGSGHQQFAPSGNIQADPLFVNPENGDFRLQEGSPAIGAGVAPLSGYDHDGVSWHDPPSIGPFTKEKLFSLNIEINDKGSAKVNGEKFTNPLSFKRETTLYIEAIPEPGWIFSHWEGATTSIVNPLKIIMNDDKFIEAVFLEEEVKYNIYPNPARDYFSIYFEGKSFEPGSFITPVERQSFRIIDLLGRIVYEDFLDPGITVVQIPGHISTGIYIIELLLGGLSVYVQRLIITK